MQPAGGSGADSMGEAERNLWTFGITRSVTSHQFKRDRGGHRKDSAIIAPENWMGVLVRLAGVKKENIVPVGEESLPAMPSTKEAAANEDYTMCRARLFATFACIVNPALEIGNP